MITPSLTARLQQAKADVSFIACGFINNAPLFVASEERLFLGLNNEIKLHNGMILDVCFAANLLYTSGDDGKIVSFQTEAQTLIEHKGKWIEKIAVSHSGEIAYSIGKTVIFQDKKGVKELPLPSSAGGLAFAPKGLKLAVAHYQGVTLWSPNLIDNQTEFLKWNGSHLGVFFSPDNRFVISTMQEPQLHGWKLDNKKDMRMSGYPLKVRSWGFTKGGEYLATSGAQEVILWSFKGSNGPMGEKPLMVAPSSNKDAHVSAVSAHPKAPVVLAGFSDGMITMARLPDGAEVLIRKPDDDKIMALAWRDDGKMLCFATENGHYGYIEI